MITPIRLLAAIALAGAVFTAPVVAHAQPQGKTAADPQQTAAVQAAAAGHTPEVSFDTTLWFRNQPLSHDPFVNRSNSNAKAANVNKQMVHFEYIDTGGMVWNSLTITALFADGAEHATGGSSCPSAFCSYPYPTSTKSGARELYMTYRGDISRTGFGGPPIKLPGVSDVMFEFGIDLNYKDDPYAARRKFLLAGPIFYLDLPGSVTFAVHLAHEFNHNAITRRDTNFHPTWNTELSYTQYFDDAHLVRWEGVFNVTGSKGMDTTLSKTTTEFYNYNQIVLDVGQLINLPPHKLDLFAGVQFWYNKFGYPAWGHAYGVPDVGAGAGAVELTPYFGIGVHF
jgi:hypothetical protein